MQISLYKFVRKKKISTVKGFGTLVIDIVYIHMNKKNIYQYTNKIKYISNTNIHTGLDQFTHAVLIKGIN
jgi:hypothetical protein